MAERLLIEARNRVVAVEDGTVVEPEGRFERVLRFPDADVRPGLVNAHEHLHRNHYGRLGAPPYADACQWAADIQQRHRREIRAGRAMRRREALLVGAWKNLFAGVTTVVHHDRWEADFGRGFPLRVVRLACADSLGMAPDLAGIEPGKPFCIHLAEGTGPQAAAEIFELDARGLLDGNCLAVHCVGLAGEGVELFRASGAAMVWCPSSNLFLFGRTAPAELLREGVSVLLGSDSLLTGAGNLLDELRVARSTGLLGDAHLAAAVGTTAVRRLGLPGAELQPGEPADLVVLSKPLLEAGAEDVELVMVGGAPRVARAGAAEALERWGWPGQAMTVAGVTRWTCSGNALESARPMNRRGVGAALPGQRAWLSSAAERTVTG